MVCTVKTYQELLQGFILAVCAFGVLGIGCGSESSENDYSTALKPTLPEAHYVDQANRYFDALDESADPESLPTYSALVIRWEWPPWLFLTGYGAEQMEALDEAVKQLTPATIPTRDCRFFPVQPFARCRVVFDYAEGPCPIYEEFTFNDQGEITFIEAWSDLPGMLPMDDAIDPWAEGKMVHRLSTKVPGLGNATGLIDPMSEHMKKLATNDAEIDSLLLRIEYFWPSWLEELEAAGDDLFQRGCGWSVKVEQIQ